jgi:DNA polymerase
LTVEAEGSDRIIRLPSGRGLHYHKVSTGSRLRYLHIQGYREDTYGGRLAENVTQAVARDLLADAMLRLDEAGYYVVGHVHDEVIVESDDLEGIRRIMKTGPDWSEGLPLDASADLAERYTK